MMGLVESESPRVVALNLLNTAVPHLPLYISYTVMTMMTIIMTMMTIIVTMMTIITSMATT